MRSSILVVVEGTRFLQGVYIQHIEIQVTSHMTRCMFFQSLRFEMKEGNRDQEEVSYSTFWKGTRNAINWFILLYIYLKVGECYNGLLKYAFWRHPPRKFFTLIDNFELIYEIVILSSEIGTSE